MKNLQLNEKELKMLAWELNDHKENCYENNITLSQEFLALIKKVKDACKE